MQKRSENAPRLLQLIVTDEMHLASTQDFKEEQLVGFSQNKPLKRIILPKPHTIRRELRYQRNTYCEIFLSLPVVSQAHNEHWCGITWTDCENTKPQYQYTEEFFNVLHRVPTNQVIFQPNHAVDPPQNYTTKLVRTHCASQW